MPFAEADRYRIIRHLFLPISQSVFIQTRMIAAAAESEILVQQVQSLLAQLDNLATTLATERNSANGALIKADVLEWEGGGRRTDGMISQRRELQEQLANLLGVELKRDRTRLGTTSIEIEVHS